MSLVGGVFVVVFLLCLFALVFLRYVSLPPGPALSLSPFPRRLLLVTAHPDDEAMFFSPLLSRLRLQGHEVHLLCLTDGGGEGGGCGVTRRRELSAAAAALGVPGPRVRLAPASAGLRDGAREAWDPAVAAAVVAREVGRVRPAAVATFDAAGVTGHPNHCATHWAVVAALAAAAAARGGRGAGPHPTLLLLETLPLWLRFLGPLAALAPLRPRSTLAVAPGPWPWVHAHRAMLLHASQYVWHRRLWVMFSSYSVFNAFHEGT
jgi:N-acetylglucosaminylphosphatidylinositol deacetylase